MRPTINYALTSSCLLLAISFGCKKSDESGNDTTPANAEQRTTQPATISAPPNAGEYKPNAVERPAMLPGQALELDGITMVVPEGWEKQEIQPGPFAAIAAFKLPRADGDPADGSVRITHYPNMKGMDDMNIDRWMSQVTRDDGTRYTREDAKYAVREVGNIRVKIVDMTGNVQATMAESPQPNSRMIATIIDHPQGPHFVLVSGPVATMSRWEGSVSAFLRSATVQ